MLLRGQITTKGALLLALSLIITGCGKQDEQLTESTPAAASSPAFPAGNGKAMTLADCDMLPMPKPSDDSAAGRAAAVSMGVAARAECRKAVATRDSGSADLARIREIKEKEQADEATRAISDDEWRRRVKEGGSRPIRELTY